MEVVVLDPSFEAPSTNHNCRRRLEAARRSAARLHRGSASARDGMSPHHPTSSHGAGGGDAATAQTRPAVSKQGFSREAFRRGKLLLNTDPSAAVSLAGTWLRAVQRVFDACMSSRGRKKWPRRRLLTEPVVTLPFVRRPHSPPGRTSLDAARIAAEPKVL